MLFKLLLMYIVVFYSQIGNRIPALGAIRIEFVLGVLILATIFLTKSSRNTRLLSDTENSKVQKAFILLICCMVISIPTGYWISHSLDMLELVFKYVALFIMIVTIIETEKQLKIFVWTYLLMVFLIVGEPFFGVYLGTASWDYHRGYPKLFGVTGLWHHPNSLGGFAAANLPFLYYLYWGETSKLLKLLIIVIAISSLGTVIYTGSRTAYVGVLCVLVAILFLGKNRGKKLFGVILAVIVLWFVMPEDYRNQFMTLKEAADVVEEDGAGIENVDGSMLHRWQIIQDGVEIFLDRPITGVGIGNFATARARKSNIWMDAHNLYLQVLTETGILGGIAFFFVIKNIFGNLRESKIQVNQSTQKDEWLNSLISALQVFLFARLCVGMFGHDLYENYWWLAGGLSIVALRVSQKKNNST